MILIARLFVDRPVFAWVISIVITLAGVTAGLILPIAQYPDITPPTVSVSASYPGASARVVADTVAAPIEQQVNGVERMLYMSSQSGNDGSYTLTITFEIGTDLNMAQVLVQNRVALAMAQLPDEVQRQGVTIKKKSPDIMLVVSLYSPADSPPEYQRDQLYLSNYATIFLRDELLRLDGVGDVMIIGQQDYSMRAWLDPDKLAAAGLSASDVVKAIREQNVQVAAGQIGQEPAPPGQAFQLTMSTLGRLSEPQQFADIVVKVGSPSSNPATPAGANSSAPPTAPTPANPLGESLDAAARARSVVRLKDVVRDNLFAADGTPIQLGIELTAKNQDTRCTLNGMPSAGLAIYQLPGSNALETARRVKDLMRTLAERFPQGVAYRIEYDTTPFIQQSVEEVFSTLRDAVILVAIVVLFFLQDWRAMILPMIDVPVALTGTMAVMWVAGFSLNNLTLFGLVLVIGIVVDDAIVVLENIERWVAQGIEVREATIKAMAEITGPIIAITLVLSAVFIPSAFIAGISGQFFRQFALTIACAMVISAINAMTLAPARAVSIFRAREKANKGGHHDSHAGMEALPWWGWGILVGYLIHAALFRVVPPPPTPKGLEPEAWNLMVLSVFIAGGLAVGRWVGRYLNRIAAAIFRVFNHGFERFTQLYGRVVAGTLRVTLIMLLVYGGLLALTYLGLSTTPIGFIPFQDKGYLLVNAQLPDAASVQRTSRVLEELDHIARENPAVQGTVGIAGMSVLAGSNASNYGTMFITLKDFETRKHDPKMNGFQVLFDLQHKVRQRVGDAKVSLFPAPPVNGLGSAGGYRLIIEDRIDSGPQSLQQATDDLVAKLNATPGLGVALTPYRAGIPQLYANIDRLKCQQLGVPLSEVFNTLQVYLGGLYVNDFNKFGRTWQVIVQADAKFRVTADYIRNLRVRNDQGQMVPLGSLATIEDAVGPNAIMRYNMYTAAAINGNLPATTSTGQGIRLIEQAAHEVLPRSMVSEWTELFYLQLLEGNSALYAFAGAVILVYLILAALYESWTLPLAILLVVPMCVLSAVVGLKLTQLEINIFTQVGLIVLVGLAAKNAILIVEFAQQRRGEGLDLVDATLDAARTRLRPIVMTSFAFILGVVPLVLASGAGAEMRITLGIAVFSGMIGVTLFGVILTPIFYYAIERWIVRERKSHSKGSPPGTTRSAPSR